MNTKINYDKLMGLHKCGLLTSVSSIYVYPGQIEFEFDKALDDSENAVLNEWFINFFIDLSNEVMERPCMTSCTLNFSISENGELLCEIEAEIDPDSDLFISFNDHEDDFEETEEWVEIINMKNYFYKERN